MPERVSLQNIFAVVTGLVGIMVGLLLVTTTTQSLNRYAAIQSDPGSGCGAGEYFCGCNGCTNTGGLTCSAWCDQHGDGSTVDFSDNNLEARSCYRCANNNAFCEIYTQLGGPGQGCPSDCGACPGEPIGDTSGGGFGDSGDGGGGFGGLTVLPTICPDGWNIDNGERAGGLEYKAYTAPVQGVGSCYRFESCIDHIASGECNFGCAPGGGCAAASSWEYITGFDGYGNEVGTSGCVVPDDGCESRNIQNCDERNSYQDYNLCVLAYNQRLQDRLTSGRGGVGRVPYCDEDRCEFGCQQENTFGGICNPDPESNQGRTYYCDYNRCIFGCTINTLDGGICITNIENAQSIVDDLSGEELEELGNLVDLSGSCFLNNAGTACDECTTVSDFESEECVTCTQCEARIRNLPANVLACAGQGGRCSESLCLENQSLIGVCGENSVCCRQEGGESFDEQLQTLADCAEIESNLGRDAFSYEECAGVPPELQQCLNSYYTSATPEEFRNRYLGTDCYTQLSSLFPALQLNEYVTTETQIIEECIRLAEYEDLGFGRPEIPEVCDPILQARAERSVFGNLIGGWISGLDDWIQRVSEHCTPDEGFNPGECLFDVLDGATAGIIFTPGRDGAEAWAACTANNPGNLFPVECVGHLAQTILASVGFGQFTGSSLADELLAQGIDFGPFGNQIAGYINNLLGRNSPLDELSAYISPVDIDTAVPLNEQQFIDDLVEDMTNPVLRAAVFEGLTDPDPYYQSIALEVLRDLRNSRPDFYDEVIRPLYPDLDSILDNIITEGNIPLTADDIVAQLNALPDDNARTQLLDDLGLNRVTLEGVDSRYREVTGNSLPGSGGLPNRFSSGVGSVTGNDLSAVANAAEESGQPIIIAGSSLADSGRLGATPGDIDIFCAPGQCEVVRQALDDAGFGTSNLPIQISEIPGDVVRTQRAFHNQTGTPYLLLYPNGDFEFRTAGDFFYEWYDFRHE